MKIILSGPEEYAYAPQRLQHIIAVINDVPSWRKAIFALTIGAALSFEKKMRLTPK